MLFPMFTIISMWQVLLVILLLQVKKLKEVK